MTCRVGRFQFILVCLFGGLLWALPTESQELIANGTFDSGINGWEVKDTLSGNLTWDAGLGLPPGGLRIDGGDLAAGTTNCFQFEEQGLLTLSFDAFMGTTNDNIDCTLNYFFYTDADDCTGNFSIIAENGQFQLPGTTLPNEWENISFELDVPEDPVNTTGVLSYQPILVKNLDIGDDGFCVYDNVSLFFEPLSVTAIPTLNEKSLLVLTALLALAGAAVLRSRG